MTKQEEIRAGIARRLPKEGTGEPDWVLADILTEYLHSQGVVITTHGFYSDLMEPLIKEK